MNLLVLMDQNFKSLEELVVGVGPVALLRGPKFFSNREVVEGVGVQLTLNSHNKVLVDITKVEVAALSPMEG